MPATHNVVLLGATGSIGESTLRIIRKHKDRLKLVGISGHRQAPKLSAIAHEFAVKNVPLGAGDDLSGNLPAGPLFFGLKWSYQNLRP